MALAVLTANVGCLTVIITLSAVFAGLWLDNTFGSKPWLTLGLVGLSLPVSLFMMFFVVRWTTSKMSFEDVQKKTAVQDRNDLD
ncbi:MAG: AtpZ/AtpI family protein [Anaerolineales bacterium]